MPTARHYARAPIHRSLTAAVVFGVALGLGCSNDRLMQPEDGEVDIATPAFAESLIGTPIPIEFETYERSRQVVHPSAVEFRDAWHGQRFWLVLTPYPNSDTHVENPSLFSSATGDDWTVPTGVSNPLATTTRGYLSDPDLVYDPSTDELRLYYREVVERHHHHGKTKHESDVVYLTRSQDGTVWSAPELLTTDAGRFVVSPTVARRAEGDWKMWSVDAGRVGCNARQTRILLRRSSDGISWSNAQAVSFTQPGFLPWHLDVQYVPELGAYWALVAAYPRGRSCTGSSLFLATSFDGVQWKTYPSPVLARGVLPEFSTNVYRSTFAFEPGARGLTIWLTGAKTEQRGNRRRAPVLRWSAAVWHTHTSALLARVRGTPHAMTLADSEPTFLRRLAAENALP
jgi:hypothetical protein